MPTRNTQVLQRSAKTLSDLGSPNALPRLEKEFEGSLLIVAGTLNDIARHAEKLRLAITTPECEEVLDYVGHTSMAGIRIDHVEEAINTLFPGRFVEP